jgi:hypothetical protein
MKLHIVRQSSEPEEKKTHHRARSKGNVRPVRTDENSLPYPMFPYNRFARKKKVPDAIQVPSIQPYSLNAMLVLRKKTFPRQM